MVFNSIAYALFLPIVLLGYWLLPRRAVRMWLLLASYVFYAAWDWRFLGLLIFTTFADFNFARWLAATDDERRRKLLLGCSLTMNLGVLGFFKYFDFFADSAQQLIEQVGWESNEVTLQFLLPLGISFYTFEAISYVFDVYRRRMEPCREFTLFALFIAYFPHLVAGPILRARYLIPQLAQLPRPPRARRIESGAALILVGLVKKVVIADSVAPVVNRVFDDPSSVGTVGAVMGIVGFAIQIYFDFSGYTDIARGTSRILGVELIHNFRQPYLSRSITEFWRRWHISLSQWLRDYLYVPLGGNQKGPTRTYINLIITMLLGGLWHGAAWHFVVWGGIHGCLLALERRFRRRAGAESEGLPRLVEIPAIAFTFTLVCFAWVFFRAVDLGNAFDVLGAVVSLDFALPDGGQLATVLVAIAAVLALDLVQRGRSNIFQDLHTRPALTGGLCGLAIAAIVVFSGGTPVEFIYFQF
jgi:D-alanyl-lipoteichoic acid acyltransferase DltB (MBOAT superfamily)